ncbi:MAG: hypothetical protein RMJ84_04300 [Sandaracinaceae bacterium]|nr:hypothetical protein [Sandaracinaceae bacterium]
MTRSKGQRSSPTQVRRSARSKNQSSPNASSSGGSPTEEVTVPSPPPPPCPYPIAHPRPSREERAFIERCMPQIDRTCAAWAAIVAERMAADQDFTEAYLNFRKRSGDIRSLFAWDALLAAEARLSAINGILARHINEDGRADPHAILEALHREHLRLAAVYATNAFLAILNQMAPSKPKWLPLSEFDPRIAVLALAHNALVYSLNVLRVPAPSDLTESILSIAQREEVWAARPQNGNPQNRLPMAWVASALFFKSMGATELESPEQVQLLYQSKSASTFAPSMSIGSAPSL